MRRTIALCSEIAMECKYAPLTVEVARKTTNVHWQPPSNSLPEYQITVFHMILMADTRTWKLPRLLLRREIVGV